MLRLLACLGFLALVVVPTLSPGQAPAQAWGDIKGQILFGGQKVPPPVPLGGAALAGIACAAKNPPMSEEYVVDKNGGVKWVLVALVHPDNPNKVIPVHPKVAGAVPKSVSFDQPCCAFEPHVLGVIQGQTVEAKNGAAFAHNVKVDGGDFNPNLNQLVPPAKSVNIAGWKAHTSTVPVSCTIHPWMKMSIRVYSHPYFTVTDDKGNWEIKNAPAGKWNLVIWHEGQGYGPGGKPGTPIEVVADKMTDLGVSKVK
jgi:hypothetical protein